MSADNKEYFEKLAFKKVAAYIASNTVYGVLGTNYEADYKYEAHKPLEGSKWQIIPRNYDKYKLLKLITDMPAGKRKYIIMHKRAYDLYMNTENPVQQDKLYELMKQLKTKINN